MVHNFVAYLYSVSLAVLFWILQSVWVMGLTVRLSVTDKVKQIFSFSKRPDWPWRSSSHPFNGHQSLLPEGKPGRWVRLTINTRLVSRISINKTNNIQYFSSDTTRLYIYKNVITGLLVSVSQNHLSGTQY